MKLHHTVIVIFGIVMTAMAALLVSRLTGGSSPAPAVPNGPTVQQFAAANEMTARQQFSIGMQSGYLLAMRGGTPQDCFVAVASAETNRGAVVNAILSGRFPVKPAPAVAAPANLQPVTPNPKPKTN